MPDQGVPFYSESGAGDSLFRVKGATSSVPPPDVVHDLLSTAAKTGATQQTGRQNTEPAGTRIVQEAQAPSVPQMDPDYGNIKTNYEKNMQPIDPTKPEYHMGIGGRIMGTLANFLSGMGGRGPTVYTGKGATNNRYDQDERVRLDNEAAYRTRLGSMDEDFARRQKLYQNDLTRYNLKDARQEQQSQAERQAQNEREQQERQRENQLAAMAGTEAQSRLGILNTLDVPFTHAERQAYIENGKLPDNPSSAAALQQRAQAIRQRQQQAAPKASAPSNPVSSNGNPYR